jgi:hypothetical protein
MAGSQVGGAEDLGALTINVRIIDGDPLGWGDEDLRAPTINARNIDDGPPGRQGQRIREHQPSMLRNIDTPRRCCRRIQESQTSMLENIDGRPLRGATGEFRSAHHQY